MEEKKNFFALLSPKSALAVGMISGVLVLCTMGFVVLLILNLKGKVDWSAKANPAQQIETGANVPSANVVKSDKPVVELFVMSYCPYGLQMEKAYLPAWELLKNKADISVKFVAYAMHGLKELEENTRQYCIGKNSQEKLISYLKCFTGKDDYKGCLAAVGLSEAGLKPCIDSTNKQFGTLTKYNDQSTWLSGNYPVYPIHQDLNDKYGVQGSPTLVINGAQADGVSRTPEAVKQAICAAFNNPPAECGTTLNTASPVAGFGAGTSGNAAAEAECGN